MTIWEVQGHPNLPQASLGPPTPHSTQSCAGACVGRRDPKLRTGGAAARTQPQSGAAGGAGGSSLPREGTCLSEVTQKAKGWSQALNLGLLTETSACHWGGVGRGQGNVSARTWGVGFCLPGPPTLLGLAPPSPLPHICLIILVMPT